MIRDFIYNILYKLVQDKKHNVFRMQWQKAELEAKLNRVKEIKAHED